MRAAWLLLSSLLLAGCVTPGAAPAEPGLGSVARFDGLITEAFPFLTEDGVTLDAWVFRPDVGDTGETVPVIINFSPYWSNLAPPAATGGDPYSLHLIERYVPLGYAVALVSVRGTGLSEGCFTIGGPQEVDDVDAMTTTLATQPWANGKAAAVAKSYDGTVAQMILTRANPHLATIVPVSPISEWYKYNYYGGVPYTDGGLYFNPYYVAAVSVQQSDDPSDGTYERTPSRFCEESLDVQAGQAQGTVAGDYGAYWQERNYTAMLPDTIPTSVFYVHGLQDWNVKPDHMTPWIDALRARDVPVKMWLGQWEHDYPHRDDWNATMLRWLDSELKGIDTGIHREPYVQVQDTLGIWRHEDEWPPARATPLVLHPSADGSLAADPGTGSGMYGDAPGGVFATAPAAASLAFETAPLDRTIRIVGSPTFTATVSATGARATLAVALLLDGKVVDQGFLDLAHRNGADAIEPLTPGERYSVSLPLFPQDIVVPAGSTLTLLVGSSSPEDALVSVTPLSVGGVVTIEHGQGTALTLPILDGDDVRIEVDQPADVGCWTC